MHGNCSVYFLVCQHFFHLFVAFLIICHFDGCNAFCFQRSNVININPFFCSHERCFHRILFAMLRSHSCKRDLRSFTKASCFQSLRHLKEGLCDHFFNFICHYNVPPYSAIRVAAKSFIAFAIKPFTSSSDTPDAASSSAAVFP